MRSRSTAVRARTWGNRPDGTLPSKGRCREIGTERRNDGRDIELTNRLNETRSDSDDGQVDARRGTHHVGASHRRGLVARSVDSGHAGRGMEPRKVDVVEADAVVIAEGETSSSKRRAEGPGTSTYRLDGVCEQGTYTRVAQEPGRSRHPPMKIGNERSSQSEGGRGGEKSERRSMSDEAGEPVPRDPAEQRAAPGVGAERGNDGRDDELTNHLNET